MDIGCPPWYQFMDWPWYTSLNQEDVWYSRVDSTGLCQKWKDQYDEQCFYNGLTYGAHQGPTPGYTSLISGQSSLDCRLYALLHYYIWQAFSHISWFVIFGLDKINFLDMAQHSRKSHHLVADYSLSYTITFCRQPRYILVCDIRRGQKLDRI